MNLQAPDRLEAPQHIRRLMLIPQSLERRRLASHRLQHLRHGAQRVLRLGAPEPGLALGAELVGRARTVCVRLLRIGEAIDEINAQRIGQDKKHPSGTSTLD